MNDAPRRLVPATPVPVLLYRHEATCSALHQGVEPIVQLPTSYDLARAVVVRRTFLSLYRTGPRNE